MPQKETQTAGVIFGSIESEGNRHLDLIEIYIKTSDVKVPSNKVVILTSNKFIVPNLEPGTYFITGFRAGDYKHSVDPEIFPPIVLKPGELKYFGAYWYKFIKTGLFERDTFKLTTAEEPSEINMLRYLERVSNGTGWEPSIKKRIIELGGEQMTPNQSIKAKKTKK